MDNIIQSHGRTLESEKKNLLAMIMRLDRKILNTKNFHFNRVGFWTNKQIKDKYRGPDSSLFEAISPMFYIIRILGLAPYRFSQNRLVPSNAHLLFSFVAVFLNTYVSVKNLIRFISGGDELILNATDRAKVSLNYLSIMIDLIITMWTRKRFAEVWNIIQNFDHETNELGYPQTDKKTKFWVWVALILNIISWLWINQAGMFAFLEDLSQNLTYMFVHIGTCFSVFKFAGITLILGQRFRHLNRIAKKCSLNETSMLRKSKINTMTIEKLRGDLMMASKKLNSLYYWSLLLWLFNLSFHSISDMYIFINWLLKDIKGINFLIYVCLAGWLIVHIKQLVLLHCVCDFASTEANRMGYILLNWRRWQSHNDNKRDFESTIHLINNNLNFTAGGCCYVNLPLLRSIAGLLTTYLVILLQLS